MKKILYAAMYLASVVTLYSEEPSQEVLNSRGQEFVTHIRDALATLSKTNPIIQGIDSVSIKSIDTIHQDKDIYQVFEFTKNVRIVPLYPSPPPSTDQSQKIITSPVHETSRLNFPSAQSITVIDPNGIDIFVGICQYAPHRPITKAFSLSKDPDSIKLYYYIGFSDKDDKMSIDTERKAIQSVLDIFGVQFVDFMMSKPK